MTNSLTVEQRRVAAALGVPQEEVAEMIKRHGKGGLAGIALFSTDTSGRPWPKGPSHGPRGSEPFIDGPRQSSPYPDARTGGVDGDKARTPIEKTEDDVDPLTGQPRRMKVHFPVRELPDAK